jgi:poly(glycerol-phosphate) alpha-glucosyltransferase
VRGLAQSQAAIPGLEVHVHGVEDRDTSRDLAAWLPFKPVVHRRLGPAAWSFAPSMRRAVMETPCDLLHSHGLWQYPSFLSQQWRARFHRPHLISPRGALDPWALSHSRWKKKLAGLCFENKHLSEASCLHALCVSEAQSFRRYSLRNPIAIIPNGVELPILETTKAESRKHKVLLFLGRLHPKKGLIPLLRSWAELKKTESRKQNIEMWNLLIIGWDQGGHEAELKRCCRDLGIESSVQFHGPAHGAEKDALFRQADAFVLPSFSEGLPMAVLEAWSYALPVFITEACNLTEGFEHGAAFKLKIQDNKIHGLSPLGEIGEAELRAMGARGRRLVEDRFTWPIVASQMKAVYDWLLGGGNPPPTVLQK